MTRGRRIARYAAINDKLFDVIGLPHLNLPVTGPGVVATPIQAVQRMTHRSRPESLYGQEPYVPLPLRAAELGLRPSFESILKLLDQGDPAWPAVAGTLRELIEAGVEIDEASVAIAMKVGRRRWLQGDAAGNRPPVPEVEAGPVNGPVSIVYYIRRSGLIKIGTTVNPAQRFADLLPDEILAAEPGGEHEEGARHRQFRHLRCQGEHFRPEPELLFHADSVRAVHGDPDPSWPTSKSAAVLRPDEFASLRSTGAVTMDEAVTGLGFSRSTIRSWVRLGLLRRAGCAGDGHLYYVDDLMALRPRCHKKRRG